MNTKRTKQKDSKPDTVEEATRRLREVEGQRAFHLDLFGDHLAEREGYKEHKGREALHYYLVQKHHWLPSQARSLSWDDLQFLFDEEMSGWHVPPQFRS
jgi:hypothetical protein